MPSPCRGTLFTRAGCEGNCWWWYWNCETEWFRGRPLSITELPGESSASTIWQSGFSLGPVTELALVVADDSVEACC